MKKGRKKRKGKKRSKIFRYKKLLSCNRLDYRSSIKTRSTRENLFSPITSIGGFKFESCFPSIDERFGSTRAIYLIVYVSRANYNRIPIKIYSTSRTYASVYSHRWSSNELRYLLADPKERQVLK